MSKIAAILLAAIILVGPGYPASGATSEEMKPVLAEVKKSLDRWLGALDNDLRSAAQVLSTENFNGKGARDTLAGLCIGRTYVIDAVIMDKTGKAIAVRTPGNRHLYEKDLSAQENAVQVEVTQKPAMSSEFRSAENKYMIVFEYPIFSANNSYLGSVSLLVDQADYLSGIIKPIVRHMPCKIWMVQPDGNVVYTEYPEFLDKNIFSDDIFQMTKSLHDFVGKVAVEKSGQGSYDYHIPNHIDEVVKRNGAWDTVGLYGSEWRVIAVNLAD